MKLGKVIKKSAVVCMALTITLGSLEIPGSFALSYAEEYAEEPVQEEVVVAQEAELDNVEVQEVVEDPPAAPSDNEQNETPDEGGEASPDETPNDASGKTPEGNSDGQENPEQNAEDSDKEPQAPEQNAEDSDKEPQSPDQTGEAEEDFQMEIPEDTKLEESAEESFREGYAIVSRGTELFDDVDSKEVIGTFNGDAYAYAKLVQEEASEENNWFKVIFDTADRRENNEDPVAGYVQLKSLTPLTEEQTEDLLEAADKDDDIRTSGDRYLILTDAFELKTEDQNVPQEENGAPADTEPENAVTELSVKYAQTSGDNVNIRKGAKIESEVVGKVVDKGTQVTILGMADLNTEAWYLISFNGVKGYIRSDLIEPLPDTESDVQPVSVMAASTAITTAPVMTSAAQETITSARLSWEAVEGVDGYAIYGRNASSAYAIMKEVDAATLETVIEGLMPGTQYYFKVAVYTEVNGEKQYGKLSNVKGIELGLPGPELVKVQQKAGDKVYIEWNAVEGAEGYSVYRREKSESQYKYIAGTTSQEKTNVTVGGVVIGATYYYKVRTYTMVNGEKKLSPNYSNAKEITFTSLPGPEWEKVEQGAPGTVTLKWKAVTGAAGYSVYRSMSENGAYVYVGGTTDGNATTLEQTNLTRGATYYYKVRAYELVDGERKLSPSYSDAVSVTISNAITTAPVMTSAAQETLTSARLSWEAVEGVDGYAIYGRNASSAYAIMKEVDAATLETVIEGLTAGMQYYFKVAVYTETNGEKQYGKLSNVKGIKMGPLAPELLNVDQIAANEVRVEWQQVDGVTGYSVYQSETPNGAFKYVGGTTDEADNLISVFGVEPAKTYFYKVKAYVTIDGSKVFSNAFSNVKEISIGLAAPSWVGCEQTGDKEVLLKWQPVDNADGYAVYRSDRIDGTYSQIAQVEAAANAYSDVDVEIGKTYFYKLATCTLFGEAVQPSALLSEVESLTITEQKHVYGDFVYGYNEAKTAITILAYTGSDAAVSIPDTIDALPITEIGDDAFADNSTITTVHVPETVEVIGMRAFKNCVNLKEMD